MQMVGGQKAQKDDFEHLAVIISAFQDSSLHISP